MTFNVGALEREIDKLTANDKPADRALFARYVYDNCARWTEFLSEDPELARLEMRIAWCARIEQTEPEGSPQRAAAIREDRRLRGLRLALWTHRAEIRKAQVPF